jgi:hypothetical protein
MTRKDYELLAHVFAETKPVQMSHQTDEEQHLRYGQWERTIRALCDALEADNPRFNRSLFQYAATEPIAITIPRWNADGSRK